ncbi:hypothetical protein LCGC14_1661250 [marine sediment metagenome]|uniref:Uncharacterized protein n=1 Tax=marine sediment metagenome TaxID=412755 RepID=A0A0F9HU11_9ZZZZ
MGNSFDEYEDWFKEDGWLDNFGLNDNQAKEVFDRIMKLPGNFRELTKEVFCGDSDAQKGFSTLLKSCVELPAESTEINSRLMALRFEKHRFLINSLFALYRDYPEYRKPIMDKFRFYDDSHKFHNIKKSKENSD